MTPVVDEGDRSKFRHRVFEQTIGMNERQIAAGIREVIRFSLGVLFFNDVATNELEVAYAFGDSSEFIRGLRIPLGQRLSGWVAVNGQTIMNSDAALDLGDTARTVGLRVCLSTPLISKDHILGVLTLYSTAAEGFTDTDRSAIELFARQTLACKATA
jgi:GAF domain-containing protein